MIAKPLTVSGNAATMGLEVEGYRVTVTIEPPAGKPLTEKAARLALTAAMSEFPQLKTSGPW